MKHLGDITKIKGFDVPLVDIVCGGSPCQDLSVAGLRKGLQHSDLGNEETTRSGLFMEQIRIIKEMREHDRANKGADVDFRLLRPRFMVWENVPGAFSSNGGEDFRAVLEETAKVVERDACIPRIEGGQRWTPSGCIMGDGWSIAWRVHDAQFWGVPQRRKRIALVADFGGECAPKILFERKSLYGDIEESGKQREEATRDIGTGSKETSKCLATASFYPQMKAESQCFRDDDISVTLANGTNPGYQNGIVQVMSMQAIGEYKESEQASALKQRDYKDATDLVVYGLDRASFNQGQNALYDFSIEEEKAQTLVAKGPGGVLTKLSEHCAQEITKGVGSQYVDEGKVIVQSMLCNNRDDSRDR